MFHKEFYPTPQHVIDMMCIDPTDKVCYEPHAGKGDIVDYLNFNGAKSVIASEINKDLRSIVASKCLVIGDDFFKVLPEQISHVEMIVMNPPFSDATDHIRHAWEIAPEGCEIISLCNWSNIEKDYSRTRREINSLIKDYGNKINLGDCFSDAERKTNVEVGLIKLYKPIYSEKIDYSGFFLDDDDEEQRDVNGLIPFNEVRRVVNSYVGAMKVFDKVYEQMESLNYTCSAIGVEKMNISFSQKENIYTKEEFSIALQKKSWNYIIDKMDLKKYSTEGMINKINKMVETQTKIPFTMKNIYHMMDMIFQTREQNFNEALVKAVDNFTKYTHENRFNVEGWKTNESYMLNKKFIIDRMTEFSYRKGVTIGRYGSRGSGYLDDLTKVLCFITGKKYNNNTSFYYMKNWSVMLPPKYEGESERPSEDFETNKWYTFHEFFDFKVFKKGTMHLKFKNNDEWAMLNMRYGKLKGQKLPEMVFKD